MHPEAFEVCNGLDDDCDGEIDELDPVTPDDDPDPTSGDEGDGGTSPAADGEDSGGCRLAGGTTAPRGTLWGLLLVVGFLGRRRNVLG